MLFNSYEFLILFLPITFFIFFYLSSGSFIRLRQFFLLASSLFFYGWWKPIYLPILVFSILINFYIGKNILIENRKYQKRLFLIFGLFINIIVLLYFKYTNFFIGNFNFFLGTNLDLLKISLPLAISFFTFQQIAYLIDCYQNKTKEYNLLNYAVFVSFFPQLIAGPIVHHKEMMPQFSKLNNKIDVNNVVLGIFIFGIGIFKKVVLADKFAVWANAGFDTPNLLTFFEAWVISISYTFQLYFDFSGYTDMAIGIALLFNIVLPFNFNSPYKAKNIQEFWNKWHITLSRFLKDYIYIPLGGNRKGEIKTFRNVMATFILGGFWHGAEWTFLFWGFLHGLALIINRVLTKIGIKFNKYVSWFITFNFLNLTWIFFRAKDWNDAIRILRGMIGLEGIKLPYFLSKNFSSLNDFGVESFDLLSNINGDYYTISWILLGFIIVLIFENSNKMLLSFKLTLNSSIFIFILYSVSFLNLNEFSEFLYFNF